LLKILSDLAVQLTAFQMPAEPDGSSFHESLMLGATSGYEQ
jgi:hypothetical protein